MKTCPINPKGQVTIPLDIREKLKLKPGDKIIYKNTAAGVLLKPAKRDMLVDYGFLNKKGKPTQDLEIVRKAVREKIAAKRLKV